MLNHCSTEVAKGEVVVVCGPSGSGKSTLIKCVNGGGTLPALFGLSRTQLPAAMDMLSGDAGNGARRGRHVHVHHDGSGRVLAEWGKPSTSTASPSRRCNTPVCTENLVRIDLMRESLNVGHDGRADISLRAGIYKDRANKANVKIGQRKCHITST